MIRTQMVMLGLGEDSKVVYIHRNHSFPGLTLEGWHVAHSRLLVCPQCWNAWALLKFVDDTYAWPTAQFCKDCSPPVQEFGWFPVPGSLLVEEGWGVIDSALLNALPEDLLRREFDLHMEAFKS